MRDAIQELEDAIEGMRRAWDDHDCKTDEEEAHAAGYDEGRDEFRKKLLDDIETWKRQAAVGLVRERWTLQEMEDWVKRS